MAATLTRTHSPVTVEALLEAESVARLTSTLAFAGADAGTRARARGNQTSARAALYALVDAASPEVLAAYGQARAAR